MMSTGPSLKVTNDSARSQTSSATTTPLPVKSLKQLSPSVVNFSCQIQSCANQQSYATNHFLIEAPSLKIPLILTNQDLFVLSARSAASPSSVLAELIGNVIAKVTAALQRHSCGLHLTSALTAGVSPWSKLRTTGTVATTRAQISQNSGTP